MHRQHKKISKSAESQRRLENYSKYLTYDDGKHGLPPHFNISPRNINLLKSGGLVGIDKQNPNSSNSGSFPTGPAYIERFSFEWFLDAVMDIQPIHQNEIQHWWNSKTLILERSFPWQGIIMQSSITKWHSQSRGRYVVQLLMQNIFYNYIIPWSVMGVRFV